MPELCRRPGCFYRVAIQIRTMNSHNLPYRAYGTADADAVLIAGPADLDLMRSAAVLLEADEIPAAVVATPSPTALEAASDELRADLLPAGTPAFGRTDFPAAATAADIYRAVRARLGIGAPDFNVG